MLARRRVERYRATPMHYVSTRGSAPALGFEDVTLAGLASDGGLYVPESWPSFSADQIRALSGLSYVETAVRVMTPFVAGSLGEEELSELCAEIGRASWRERVCQYVSVSVVAVSLKKKLE